MKCKKGFRVKGERGFTAPLFERFVRFNKYIVWFVITLTFPFNFNFIVYFSKHQNVLEYFVTEQKAMLSLKITFGGDFDPSSSSFRDLFTVFKFLMFNKSKYQENR